MWCIVLKLEWIGKYKCCVEVCMYEVFNKYLCKKKKNLKYFFLMVVRFFSVDWFNMKLKYILVVFFY